MAGNEASDLDKKKTHRERRAGRKSEKKKMKNSHEQELSAKQRNPKAFTFNSVVKAERQFRRTQDIETKKQHIPVVDRTPVEPPPVVIAVVGPPKVGKSTLIQCLVKNFAKQPLTSIKGPVTIVSGKKRRLTIIECNNDINCMIDIAKIADLVLLLVDASFGFEMEIFEFLNICQVHGMPRIMGVLTHLDALRDNKALRKKKRQLKHRFWTEVYPGAKLFYLSGQLHGEYMKNEVKNLGRFISVMKFRPLTWRTTHPYILADRMEDLTPPHLIRQNPKANRKVSLYGYVRGVPLNKINNVHIPGCGDFSISDVSLLPDPCPLPEKVGKRRSLIEKDQYVYAPFSGVGGIVYDKDAVYVELGGSHSHKAEESGRNKVENSLVTSLLDTKETLDIQMAQSQMKMFSNTEPMTAEDFNRKRAVEYEEEVIKDDTGRSRRKVIFPSVDNDDGESGESSEEEEENDGDEEMESEGSSSSEEEEPVEEMVEAQENVPKEKKKEKKKKGIKSSPKTIRSKDNEVPPWEKEISDEEDEEPMQCSDGEAEHLKNLKSPSKKLGLKDIELKLLKEIGMNEEERMDSDENEPMDSAGKTVGESEGLDSESEEENSDEEARGGDAHHLSTQGEGADRTQSKKGGKKCAVADKVQEYRVVGNKHDKDIHDRVRGTLALLEKKSESASEESEEDVSGSDEESGSEIDGSEGEGGVSDDEDGGSDDENGVSEDSEGESEGEGDDPDEDMGEESAARWKKDLAKRASNAFYDHQNSISKLRSLVYGNAGLMKLKEENGNGHDEDEDEPVGGLFTVVREKQRQKAEEKFALDGIDTVIDLNHTPRNWLEGNALDSIKDCFVTGKWGESENAEDLLEADDFVSDDESLYGDFEDLETGEKHSAKPKSKDGEPMGEKDPASTEQDDKAERDRLSEKKRKLKEKFNAEYDEFGRGGGDKSFYEELKKEADMQSKVNRSAFEDLDDSERVLLEGYRPGMYLRVEMDSVPCELITNFDPTYPLIIGGLLPGEENVGYVQVRIKKHRWYKKILKTRDPLIISLGWRRFQTLPLYSKLEDNLRNRLLKYTPEHVHCMAHFWGPITPQSTGFLAIQDIATKQPGFRIAATGSVVELDKSTCIVKKLKLVGTPMKIYKKTAFIQGMFNSALEVARFEGAKIKTVSGIRGQIKKAASKPEGVFRATFEDKILLSDIVFCRTWYKMDVPQFYNPVTSLLLPPSEKNSWRGMKTVGQIKREQGIHAQPEADSLYTDIVRQPKVFRPLMVPKALQKELPYKYKPKVQNKKPGIESKRIAVIRDPHEQKVAALMKRIKVTYNNKQMKLRKDMHKRIVGHKKAMAEEGEKKAKREKMARKQIFRSRSKSSGKAGGKGR
ncbi:ribosome biogenesis protein BMS1 homolog [Ischnura elegans]|uniref:ribosome biogenesis protein BMS1 homolog n=1 Tax=Ischnura elegans TaxID=197161 RepID=UPI001ED89FA7|nr:ribosome biogenesis protein BMS1 homolog [Ischnura elegans]